MATEQSNSDSVVREVVEFYKKKIIAALEQMDIESVRRLVAEIEDQMSEDEARMK